MRKPKQLLYIVVLATSSLLAACSTTSTPVRYNTSSLAGLQSMHRQYISAANSVASAGIRRTAIRETALTLGAQAALAVRAKKIDAVLLAQARRLDKTFDFNMLMLPQNVVPPVLLEGRSTLNLADEDTIRLSDRTYKILHQARFATTSPQWRDYLWMDYEQPEQPDNTLLPKNAQEQAMWNYYIAEGWKNGIHQCNSIFADNLARLTEDFKGMVLYRKLLAQRMVSRPFVAKLDLGVTGDATQVNINDQLLRITALPELQLNSKLWKAAVSKDNTVYPAQALPGDRPINHTSPNLMINTNNWQTPPRH